jgi:hypothetical protein
MKNDGELILKPDYQRNYVAPIGIASRLIESILIDVPIPVIYLAEEPDGRYSVIDGQQRLTSFLSYIEGKFPNGKDFRLSKLKVLSGLNNKKFDQLDKTTQAKIKTTTLHSIIIKKESNEDIKFEIFERLNTGSIKLNEDEIRNTVYRGRYIKLLAELSENTTFHNLVDLQKYKDRMIYRGMILRFFALSEKSYINYKTPMKQFCNKQLRDNRNLLDEKYEEFKKRFEHCVELVRLVYGNTAFRRYISAQGDKPGYWSINKVNMALYDVQMVGFARYEKRDVLKHADSIRDGILNLMINNNDFIQAIELKTSNTKILQQRFKLYDEMLSNVIKDSLFKKRTFPYELKKQLFEKNPVCAISKQRILSIEDAEVDHIIPFSKGGETNSENAQLVLRHFNRAKNNNTNFSL